MACNFFLSLVLFISGPGEQGQPGPSKCGQYVRKWLGLIPIYECAFYMSDAEKAKSTFVAQTRKPSIDDVARYITDTSRHITYRLEIVPLLGLKRYSAEKKALIGTLERAGFKVNDQWVLQNNKAHQQDINMYVDLILGKNEDTPGKFYAKRAKGDRYILEIQQGTRARLRYIPSGGGGENSEIRFKSADVLRGIILTYISERQCSEELRRQLPKSLLKNLSLSFNDQ